MDILEPQLMEPQDPGVTEQWHPLKMLEHQLPTPLSKFPPVRLVLALSLRESPRGASNKGCHLKLLFKMLVENLISEPPPSIPLCHCLLWVV